MVAGFPRQLTKVSSIPTVAPIFTFIMKRGWNEYSYNASNGKYLKYKGKRMDIWGFHSPRRKVNGLIQVIQFHVRMLDGAIELAQLSYLPSGGFTGRAFIQGPFQSQTFTYSLSSVCLLMLAFNTTVILAPKEIMTKKNIDSLQRVSF